MRAIVLGFAGTFLLCFGPIPSTHSAGPPSGVSARVITRKGAEFLVRDLSLFWNNGRGGNSNPAWGIKIAYAGASLVVPYRDIEMISLTQGHRALLTKRDGKRIECERADIGWVYGYTEDGKIELDAQNVSRIEMIHKDKVALKECPQCHRAFEVEGYRYCPYCGTALVAVSGTEGTKPKAP